MMIARSRIHMIKVMMMINVTKICLTVTGVPYCMYNTVRTGIHTVHCRVAALQEQSQQQQQIYCRYCVEWPGT